MIESGTFASVSKALDSLVTVDGQISEAAGEPRLLSAEHMALLQVIAKDSPEIEYVRGDSDDFSEEKKRAIEVLANLALVFPDNNRYASGG